LMRKESGFGEETWDFHARFQQIATGI